MISGSSAFSKNIWKFTVHILLEPGFRILSITLLACEMSAIVWQFELSLPLPFFDFHFHALEKEMATHSSVLGCLKWWVHVLLLASSGWRPGLLLHILQRTRETLTTNRPAQNASSAEAEKSWSTPTTLMMSHRHPQLNTFNTQLLILPIPIQISSPEVFLGSAVGKPILPDALAKSLESSVTPEDLLVPS